MKCDVVFDVIYTQKVRCFFALNVRLTKEMTALTPASIKVTIVAQTENIVFELRFDFIVTLCVSITKDEYDESGPAMVHRKCF